MSTDISDDVCVLPDEIIIRAFEGARKVNSSFTRGPEKASVQEIAAMAMLIGVLDPSQVIHIIRYLHPDLIVEDE